MAIGSATRTSFAARGAGEGSSAWMLLLPARAYRRRGIAVWRDLIRLLVLLVRGRAITRLVCMMLTSGGGREGEVGVRHRVWSIRVHLRLSHSRSVAGHRGMGHCRSIGRHARVGHCGCVAGHLGTCLPKRGCVHRWRGKGDVPTRWGRVVGGPRRGEVFVFITRLRGWKGHIRDRSSVWPLSGCNRILLIGLPSLLSPQHSSLLSLPICRCCRRRLWRRLRMCLPVVLTMSGLLLLLLLIRGLWLLRPIRRGHECSHRLR